MEYIMSFLEGIITFLSPCLLPMLPIYLSYFAGQEKTEEIKKNKVIVNALGFILGFTLVFVCLGAFSGTIGVMIRQYHRIISIIFGILVILLGLNYMGAFKIGMINQTKRMNKTIKITGFFSAVLFGIIFSIGWTPCIGTFLGSALMLAATQEHVIQGIGMLVCFSLGLGIPFLLSAVLLDKLKTTFDWIKQHFKVIQIIAGGFLVLVGILMTTGYLQMLLSWLTI